MTARETPATKSWEATIQWAAYGVAAPENKWSPDDRISDLLRTLLDAISAYRAAIEPGDLVRDPDPVLVARTTDFVAAVAELQNAITGRLDPMEICNSCGKAVVLNPGGTCPTCGNDGQAMRPAPVLVACAGCGQDDHATESCPFHAFLDGVCARCGIPDAPCPVHLAYHPCGQTCWANSTPQIVPVDGLSCRWCGDVHAGGPENCEPREAAEIAKNRDVAARAAFSAEESPLSVSAEHAEAASRADQGDLFG